MHERTRQFFLDTIQFFSDPSNHCMGKFAKDAQGLPVRPTDPTAVSFCIAGRLEQQGFRSDGNFSAGSEEPAWMMRIEMRRRLPEHAFPTYLSRLNDRECPILDDAGHLVTGREAIIVIMQGILDANPEVAA